MDWMKMDKHGWKCIKVDENGQKWVKWIKIDEKDDEEDEEYEDDEDDENSIYF